MIIPGLDDRTASGWRRRPPSLLQVRGEFGNLNFKTRSGYNTLFAQDAWSLNKYVTVNAGLRWEQQKVQGGIAKYTFNDNWSPRMGISVDPWGNRKTKVTANFGRYTEVAAAGHRHPFAQSGARLPRELLAASRLTERVTCSKTPMAR